MASECKKCTTPKSSLRHQYGRAAAGSPASSSSSHALPLTLSFTLAISSIYFVCSLLPSPAVAIIIPNYTVASHQLIDTAGTFLSSGDNSFQARITNSKPDSASFYLVIIHVSTGTTVWSANRNNPIAGSSELRLTADGLALYDDTGRPVWSTPSNISSVSALQLLDSGNMVLLGVGNNTLWESFDSPTDVLVAGQKLHRGKSLVSSISDEDLSEGNYRFSIVDDDAMLEWKGMDYWKLSMDVNAFRQANFPVEYLMMNLSGVYLVGNDIKQMVISVPLGDSVQNRTSDFLIAKLESKGLLSIVIIDVNGSIRQELSTPSDSCRIPFICGRLSVCTDGGGSCKCAPPFHSDPKTNEGGCVPTNASLALPGSCNGSLGGADVRYLNLTNDLDYFSNDFDDPVVGNVTLSACQNLCSRNCSCLGVFYRQGSGSCLKIRDYLGSTFNSNSSWRDTSDQGYIKTVMVKDSNMVDLRKNKPGVLAMVLPLSLGFPVIVLAAGLLWLRMKRRKQVRESSSAGAYNFRYIPGLPARFNYEEIFVATQGFRTVIGTGGFGTVYKGTLVDGTDIAVKRLDCSGAEAKREFLTEIASIGKIYHVNLVRLKGFCIHIGQRFLVYEYMNQGSLDKSLFRGKPVLEWKERYQIALGTARGLEYLHTSCEHKIIHCDVKPENILLHDSLQVKVSDFGLSKLLTREQSGFFTLIRGTRGYIAPEWLINTAISEKTDVYSYGMVLLEIVSGKKNFFLKPDGDHSGNSPSSPEDYDHQVNFPLCALEMHLEGRYLELVDPRLMGQVPSEEVEKLVRVALCCVHRDPNLRPTMSDVVRMLEGGKALGEPKIEALNFLRFYDPRALVEDNMQNEVVLHCPEMNSMNIPHPFSCISSQQVSGPR